MRLQLRARKQKPLKRLRSRTRRKFPTRPLKRPLPQKRKQSSLQALCSSAAAERPGRRTALIPQRDGRRCWVLFLRTTVLIQ